MSCEEVRRRLAEADPAALPPDLAAHVADCEGCQELLRRLERVDGLLGDLPADEPPRRVLNETLAAVRETQARPPRRYGRWALALGTPLAALLVLCFVFALPMADMALLPEAGPTSFAETPRHKGAPPAATPKPGPATFSYNLADPAEPTPSPAGATAGPMPATPEETGALRQLDTSTAQVPADDLSRLARNARIVPQFKNGQPDGYKVHGIRPGSSLDELGLENGDVLRSLDGRSLDSPDKALGAFETLHGKDQVELELDRRGERQKLTLSLTDQEAQRGAGAVARKPGKTAGKRGWIGKGGLDHGGEDGDKAANDLGVANQAVTVEGTEELGFRVTNAPPGARVTIDGQVVDGTTERVPQSGEHTVRIEQEGRRPHEQRIVVEAEPAAEGRPAVQTKSRKKSSRRGKREERQRAAQEERRRDAEETRASRAAPSASDAGFDDLLMDTPSVPRKKKEDRTHRRRGKAGRSAAPALDDAFDEDDDDFKPTTKQRKASKKAEPPPPPPMKARPRQGQPLPDTLDKKTVLNGIKRGLEGLERCAAEQSNRKRLGLKQITLGFTIQRNGKATGISIGPAKVKGTYLEGCIKKEVGTWRYPQFAGENIKVKLPLPLEVNDATPDTLPAERHASRDEQDLDALTYIDPQGYFANTYLPGDPQVEWLRRALQERLTFGERVLTLERAARPYTQPFDPPPVDGMAVFLSADRAAVEGPTRLTLQVGLKGSERHARRRAPLEVALVVDLRALPAEAERRLLWSLADALAHDQQAGDRFSLVVAGLPEPLQVSARDFGASAVRRALARAYETRATQDGGTDLAPALAAAYGAVTSATREDAPLGASLVLLASAAPALDATGLERIVHAHAVAGTGLTAIGVGAAADRAALTRLSAAGQGRQRLVAELQQTRPAIESELAASGRVVARALRLRLRLAPGVKLVEVLGSHPLTVERVARVKEAEQAIDRKVSRTLGIAADRGDDEDGIQIVIPAFYASDDHVILLDVVVPGPGAVADLRLRYKDLVNLDNAVARASLSLPAGERPIGPLNHNVRKNLLAHQLAGALRGAAAHLSSGAAGQADARLAGAAMRLAELRAQWPALNDDPELNRDLRLLAEYREVLADWSLWVSDAVVRTHLVRSLLLAGRVKLPPGV